MLRVSSASEISVTGGARASGASSTLGPGEADVAGGLSSEEGSEKLRGGELVVVLVSVLVGVFVCGGVSSLGVTEGRVVAESEPGAEGETDELNLRLDEVSTTVMLVSELVMISIALVSSVPVLGPGFVSCEESVS